MIPPPGATLAASWSQRDHCNQTNDLIQLHPLASLPKQPFVCLLDFGSQTRKNSGVKNDATNSRAENFYAAWRERCRAVNLLRDGDSTPPEKLLQAVWHHQRLQRDQLKTSDGRRLRVLHPGFASLEGGPDFRGAVLQFDHATPVSGDVEIDLQPSGWHAHGHDTNSNFQNVILHVWFGTKTQSPRSKSASPFAQIALKDVLDAPAAELALALENESGLPESLRGKCSAPLCELTAPQLSALLNATREKVRFSKQALAILARAKNSGWEQALWENLFRALGYKHNVWPMQGLAETKIHWTRGAGSAFEFQARLFGVSYCRCRGTDARAKIDGHFFAPRVGRVVARPR